MPGPTQRPSPFLVAAVLLLSAAALASEILLMRLFSIREWHHFAWMVISLALLGFGASGTFLTLFRRKLLDRFDEAMGLLALLFGFSLLACFSIVQRIPFNSLELAWDPIQFLLLFAVYAILSIPFFCAGAFIGLSFIRHKGEIPLLYGADLLGAGLGATAVILLLFALPPSEVLRALSACGFLAGTLFLLGTYAWRRHALFALMAGSILVAGWPDSLLEIRMSPYKDLSQALRIPGAEIIETRASPLAVISVLRNETVPLRQAPGLSLQYFEELPPQLGIYSDGNGPSVIIRNAPAHSTQLEFLDHLPSALPWHLLDSHPRSEAPEVLVLGAGGGMDVLSAILHRAKRIDAVELDPQVIDLVKNRFAGYAGQLYTRPGVTVHEAEARGFIERTPRRYDLIRISMIESFGAATAGVHGLGGTTLFTVEGVRTLLRRLEPGGWLAVTRWIRIPPRGMLKLTATTAVAMEREGLDPSKSVALIRGWNAATLVVKRGSIDPDEIAALRRFAEDRSFDLAWFPGIVAGETNRHNVLDEPWFFEGAAALLSGPVPRRQFIEQYKFDIEPATDQRPFFSDFFRWRVLPELVRLRGQGGTPLVDLGYLLLVLTLLQAVVASLTLILFPLRWTRSSPSSPARGRWRVLVYFGALGLAFIFVEIAYIQRLALYLSHPLYATAVVLAGFLVFAGFGSTMAGRIRTLVRNPIPVAVGSIALVAILELLAIQPLFGATIALPDRLRIVIALGMIAPLAFCMGLPMPLGLERVAKTNEPWLPWAWGINGCASVISAVLATLISIHAGSSTVVLSAIALYALAALTGPVARAAPARSP